jgi:hypothetical protein
MTEPITPERIYQTLIDDPGEPWGGCHRREEVERLWELFVEQAAEVKRLRAQVATVEEAWLGNYVEENGTITWRFIEAMRAALELTDGAEHD